MYQHQYKLLHCCRQYFHCRWSSIHWNMYNSVSIWRRIDNNFHIVHNLVGDTVGTCAQVRSSTSNEADGNAVRVGSCHLSLELSLWGLFIGNVLCTRRSLYPRCSPSYGWLLVGVGRRIVVGYQSATGCVRCTGVCPFVMASTMVGVDHRQSLRTPCDADACDVRHQDS